MDSSGVTHASVFTIWLRLIVRLITLVSLAFFLQRTRHVVYGRV